MKRLFKGLTFLMPIIFAVTSIAYVAVEDLFLQGVFIKIFYCFATLIGVMVALLVLFILWQLTKTGAYILLGTTVPKKKSESTTD